MGADCAFFNISLCTHIGYFSYRCMNQGKVKGVPRLTNDGPYLEPPQTTTSTTMQLLLLLIILIVIVLISSNNNKLNNIGPLKMWGTYRTFPCRPLAQNVLI